VASSASSADCGRRARKGRGGTARYGGSRGNRLAALAVVCRAWRAGEPTGIRQGVLLRSLSHESHEGLGEAAPLGRTLYEVLKTCGVHADSGAWGLGIDGSYVPLVEEVDQNQAWPAFVSWPTQDTLRRLVEAETPAGR
jgi:hypothetical protein